ncbi:MAG: hypothetical protein ACXVBW_13080, partial [Bdellovibrionota bacterium]
MAVGVVPLLVRVHRLPFEGALYRNFVGWSENADAFAWYKSVALVWCGFLSFLILFFVYRMKVGTKFLHVVLAGLVATVAISSFLSPYPILAFHGFPNQYETFSVMISYLALFSLTAVAARSREHFRVLVDVLALSSSLIAAMGVLEFFGVGLLDQGPLRMLVFPSELLHTPAKFQNSGLAEARSTLLHPNYLGSYLTLIFPISFAAYLSALARRAQMLFGSWSALLFATMICC